MGVYGMWWEGYGYEIGGIRDRLKNIPNQSTPKIMYPKDATWTTEIPKIALI